MQGQVQGQVQDWRVPFLSRAPSNLLVKPACVCARMCACAAAKAGASGGGGLKRTGSGPHRLGGRANAAAQAREISPRPGPGNSAGYVGRTACAGLGGPV